MPPAQALDELKLARHYSEKMKPDNFRVEFFDKGLQSLTYDISIESSKASDIFLDDVINYLKVKLSVLLGTEGQ